MTKCWLVYLYFLLSILTLSAAENITSNLCVEKALSFVKEYSSCRTFNEDTAKENLRQGNTTCKETCEVALTDIKYNTVYYLWNVKLWLNGHVYIKYLCSVPPRGSPKTFLINCVSWETGFFWEPYTPDDNTVCLYWSSTMKACYCKPGYVHVHGHCIKGYIVVGNTCVSDLQCTGNVNSGLCSNGVCLCRKGYFLYSNTCYPENVLETARCVFNKQCKEIGNIQSKRICIDGRCVCEEGYILIEHSCHEGNTVEAGSCTYDQQCKEIDNPKSNRVCIDGMCVCEDGYSMIEHTCLEVNLSLNQSCFVNNQCLGSPYASCLRGKCSCIEGYTAVNTTDCVLTQSVLNEARLQTENPESTINDTGPILGALFGGLLLGVLLASAIVYFIYRRYCYSNNKRNQPGVMYAVNDTDDDVRDDNTVQNKASSKESKEKQKKNLNVSPLTGSKESPKYSNTAKQSAAPVTDDVYNHLNEIKETQNEDTYDHACTAAARGHIQDLDD